MKAIIQLKRIISGNKSHKSLKEKPNKTQEFQLLEAIENGEIKDIEDVKQKFFANSKDKNASARNLKMRLKNNLINDLFLNIENSDNIYQQAYFNCHKKYTASKYLIGRKATKIGYQLSFETLKQAKKYHFTLITYDLAKELRYHYSVVVLDTSKAKYFNEICKKYFKILEAEEFAEYAFCEVTNHLKVERGQQDSIINSMIEYEEKLKDLLDQHQSFKLAFIYYIFLVTRYELENKPAENIENCEKALEYFENIGFKVPFTTSFIFYLRQVNCGIVIKDFEKAKQSIDYCIANSIEGSLNWHFSLQLLGFLGFQNGNYELVFAAIKKAKKKKIELKDVEELWTIQFAYLAFLQKMGFVKTEVKRFRLGKMLNEVPLFSKDKRGQNISILVVQILHLLLQKNQDAIIDRTDALKRYQSRYLKGAANNRSNIFIAILFQLEKSNFNRKAFDRRIAKLETKLKLTKMIPANIEIELIPYERTLEYIRQLLK